jgi:hypothetical protein
MERRRSFLTDWRLDAARELPAFLLANVLAAEGAHQTPLSRRLALLDTLQAARRPLLATELIGRVQARLGSDCWGGSPRRTLHDDVRRLKEAGCEIRYQRGQPPGYRWDGPHGPVDPEAVRQKIEPADPVYVKAVTGLTSRDKLQRAAEMGEWSQALRAQTRGDAE